MRLPPTLTALITLILALPLTLRLVNVPTLVIFDCVPVTRLPAIFGTVNVSVTLSKVNVDLDPNPPSLYCISVGLPCGVLVP